MLYTPLIKIRLLQLELQNYPGTFCFISDPYLQLIQRKLGKVTIYVCNRATPFLIKQKCNMLITNPTKTKNYCYIIHVCTALIFFQIEQHLNYTRTICIAYTIHGVSTQGFHAP